ncbi:MAG: acyl-CoA dehydrogenase family protein [Deltaproteobacteria bacterium]|nr:acyl-CoA dehydrogenase family protein [Deltaproteobacteria bacterium]
MELKGASQGKQEALDVAEDARETEWSHPSFVGELFMGRLRKELISPYPLQSPEDKKIGDELMAKVAAYLKANLDPDEVDRTGVIPPHVLKGLADMGLFGMKISKEYGGMGLSQVNYGRVVSMIGSYCGSTTVWLSAHQSIGVPQPLKMFGTPEQKKKYLPRLARGEVSAFALTEPSVGSDPAQMKTTATPIEDGKFFLINGEKLWCTNGPNADILVVMARTPSKFVNGREKKQITAFIVEKGMPGFDVAYHCSFMGLKGISNGLLRFQNVKVPRENIIWGEGKGLKLALMTLNAGRLTLPAAACSAAKLCISILRDWANERVQWGAPIGRHEAVSNLIAKIMADTFAMESITWFSSAVVDRGGNDIRLEAAMSKLFCSERGWRIIDDTLQIRGGRGYETGPSLTARGEKGYAIERAMRDFRINLLIEGSSEILRLFIAREALDPHMRLAGDLLNPRSPAGAKLKALGKMTAFYGKWYPARWFSGAAFKHGEFGQLSRHMKFVERKANKLARTMFHCMGRYQAGLEKRQMILARLVDIGTELFAMSASCSRAIALAKSGDQTSIELAEFYCRQARRRIKTHFAAIRSNDDQFGNHIAGRMLDGDMKWIEEGIMKPETAPAQKKPVLKAV